MSRLNAEQVNLTNTEVRGLIAPPEGREEVRDTVVRGLVVRVTSTGAKSWSVFRRVKGGQPIRVTIGSCDAITSTVARMKAKEIIAALALGNAPIKRPSVLAQIAAKQDSKKHTLEALTTAYCDFQQARGRSSHSDARGIFKNHLIDRSPSLASKPAANVTTEEISDLLRTVKEEGKDRTANKLRSYLRAAFEIALVARDSHAYPVAFKAFGITTNAAAKTQADRDANKAAKNPLKLPDMRAYWKAIQAVAGRDGAMLRTHLLTGGQRIEQLIKLQRADVAEDSITIYDSKGRGQIERAHVAPLRG